MDNFDLIVLGGGPGGYNAAERAAAGGMKVAVVEKRSLGGVCLNEGCIPSKTLLNSAKYYEHALHGDAFGVHAADVCIDHAAVIARKGKVVKSLVGGVKAKMKAHGVTVIDGLGVIDGKGADGFTVRVGDDAVTTGKLLIATGSEAVVPPIPGVKEGMESGCVLTNREILDLRELPERLVVIGGGVIGLEMASYFRSVGCAVTVVEMLDKIAGPTDVEISALLQKEYEARGVGFRLGCRVTAVGGGKVTYERDGSTEQVEADKVLLSIGRKPVSGGIGLESVGVYVERGAVVTGRNLRTNIPGIYAAGDVNGKLMLAHTAYREGEVAVNHMLGKQDEMRYEAIPSVIYTNPEVAGVGESEESAKEKGLDVQIARLSMRYSGRFLAETDRADGLCKLLVERGSHRLVGAQLIGSYASEMVWGVSMMIESRWPVERLREIVFPHPTVSEVIREALFAIE